MTPTAVGGVVVAGSLGLAAALAVGTTDANAWSGPLVVAAGVLVASGIGKLASPSASRQALAAIGLPASSATVAVIGAGEVLVGVAAGAGGGTTAAAALAVAYVLLAAVAVRMSRADGVASCGCFGATGARPGPVHVVVNLLAAGAATGAALAGAGGVAALVDGSPWSGVPALGSAAVGAAGVVALLSTAAETASLIEAPPSRRSDFHLVEAPG